MSTIEKLQSAATTAQRIALELKGKRDATPDVTEALRTELQGLKKDELIERVIELSKPKTEVAVTVQDVVTAIRTAPECAILDHAAVAAIVKQVLPDAKTTAATVASICSKKGKELGYIPREKLAIAV